MLIDLDDPHPRWLVVRTKPKQERAVVELLGHRVIDAYCPRILEPRTHRRGPLGPVPLFPSYVFARAVVREHYRGVHYCHGALGIVRFGDKLAAVEDEFIALLRQRASDRGYLVLGQVRKALEKGMRVRVSGGPLAGYEGIVAAYLPARERVRLLLQLVTGVTRAEVDVRHVRCA
jgi:transcription antitermination factor NusG